MNGKDKTHVSLFTGSTESATVLGNMARTIEAYEQTHTKLDGFFRGIIVYVPEDELDKLKVMQKLSEQIASMFAQPSEKSIIWD